MKKLLLVPLTAFLVLMMFATSGTAHAASVPAMQPQAHAVALAPMHALAPAVSCSGNGCNNTDPYATGCGNSRRLVTSTVDTNHFGEQANVDLEFSTVCQTNWTEVHPITGSGNQCLDGVINRASGPDGGALTFSFDSCSFTFINTNQVFAPHNAAQACGIIDPKFANDHLACTNFV